MKFCLLQEADMPGIKQNLPYSEVSTTRFLFYRDAGKKKEDCEVKQEMPRCRKIRKRSDKE